MADLSAVNVQRKAGQEAFSGTPGVTASLLGFWQWAYSDLIDNAQRGVLAEYIVALAIGASDGVRIAWEPYDLLTKRGVRIEVKSSAFLQSWNQKKLATPTFSIKPSQSWNRLTGQSEPVRKRQADVYVFALLKHKDKANVDPLDVAQWKFYVLAAKTLDSKVHAGKSIALARLTGIGAEECDFETLLSSIERAAIGAGGA